MAATRTRSNDELGRVLFGGPTGHTVVAAGTRQAATAPGAEGVDIDADLAKIAEDMQLPPADARKLVSLVADYRTTGVAEPEAWEQKAARWPEQSQRVLREKHGAGADQAQQRIEDYIEGNPALASRLGGGLRTHPDVTRMLDGVVQRLGGQSHGGRGEHGTPGYFGDGPVGAHGTSL